MNGFYTITQSLFSELTKAGFRVVTLGDYLKIDLKRQTIFPYAHIIPQVSNPVDNVGAMTFTIVGMDLVDFNKNDLRDEDEPFFNTDNLQDILNDIHNRFEVVIEQYKRGIAFSDLLQLNSEPSFDPFMERFENLLAGWEVTIVIKYPNNAPIC